MTFLINLIAGIVAVIYLLGPFLVYFMVKMTMDFSLSPQSDLYKLPVKAYFLYDSDC